LQIGEQVVKAHVKLHLLHIYHIVKRSELKFLIGTKVLTLQNSETGQKTVGLVRFSSLMG